MGRHVLHLVDAPHDALGVEQERDALGEVRILLVRALLGAVDLADRAGGVGEQAVREALVVGERLVLVRRVERDAEDRGTGLLELWGSITEPLSFDRSAACAGFGVPPQHGPLPALVVEVDRVAVLVRQAEPRRLLSNVHHGGSLTPRGYLLATCPSPAPLLTVSPSTSLPSGARSSTS